MGRIFSTTPYFSLLISYLSDNCPPGKIRRYRKSRYGTGTGICPSGLLLKLLGRYRLCLVS